MSRPLATLAAAAVGGVGLWLAGHWDMQTNGGYWAALGIVALVGLLVGLAQLRSVDGNAPGMFLIAWLPITVVSLWVLVSEQPVANTYRNHVRSWSNDMGIADVVHYVSPFVFVLALGIGLVFGLTMLAGYVWRQERVTVVDEAPATEAAPVAAESAPEPSDSEARTVVRNRNGQAPARTRLLVP